MRHDLFTTLMLIGLCAAPLLAQSDPGKEPAQGSKQEAEAKQLQKRIAELVDRLGDREYTVREKAFDQLIAIGPPALQALEKAKESDDPEVAASASEAIAVIRSRHGAKRKAQPKQKSVERPQRSAPREAQPRKLDDPFDGLRPLQGLSLIHI